MRTPIQLLDVIALTEDVPEQGLQRGQVGTVVEILAPDVYDVEFIDAEGRTYALATIQAGQCLKLHYRPAPTMPSTG